MKYLSPMTLKNCIMWFDKKTTVNFGSECLRVYFMFQPVDLMLCCFGILNISDMIFIG